MPTSSIDDLLLGGSSAQQPMPVEEKLASEPAPENDYFADNSDEERSGDHQPIIESYDEAISDEIERDAEKNGPNENKNSEESDTDEYGNHKEPENEVIRDRLARQARKHEAELATLRAQLQEQGASKQVQQAAKDFEYNPDSGDDWQKQLADFVKQTVGSMHKEQEESVLRQQEAKAQAEFDTKFRDGMSRFDDFVDTVRELPFEISNPMMLATRSMDNPAAFLYAAAKKSPQELERISKIRDPYAQMMEVGKLEERMRVNKQTTKAPRPLGRTPQDSIEKSPVKKVDNTGDDLLARADVKRLNTVKTRLRNNR